MRWWQWAVYIVLLFVVLSLFDGGFRTLLKGNVTVHRLEAKRNTDTLIVYLPGLIADGEWSGRQMTDTWRSFGDVWLVNPTAERFDSDMMIGQLVRELEEDHHPHVIIIGSSLGAHNALDTLKRLSPAKHRSALFDLIAVCSPGEGVTDIQQPLRAASGLASVFRFGPVTNMTWGKLYTKAIAGKQPRPFAMTYYIDQVNEVRTNAAPDQEVLATIDVVYLLAENDEIVSSSAAHSWTGDENVIMVESAKHVSYDADPEKWNKAFGQALTRLT